MARTIGDAMNDLWTKGIKSVDDTKAPINSPALTGTPTAPTPSTSDNSTRIATTNYVHNLTDQVFLSSNYSGNLDDLKTPGFYRALDTSSGLPNETHYLLVMKSGAASTVVQMAWQADGGNCFFRTYIDGHWVRWYKFTATPIT